MSANALNTVRNWFHACWLHFTSTAYICLVVGSCSTAADRRQMAKFVYFSLILIGVCFAPIKTGISNSFHMYNICCARTCTMYNVHVGNTNTPSAHRSLSPFTRYNSPLIFRLFHVVQMAAARWNCRNRFHEMSPFIWSKNHKTILNCSIRLAKRAKSMTNWFYFVREIAIHWPIRRSMRSMCHVRVAFAANCTEWIVRNKWLVICERPHVNANWIDGMDSFTRPDFSSIVISLNCMRFAMTVRRLRHYTHIIKSMDEQSNVSIRWMHRIMWEDDRSNGANWPPLINCADINWRANFHFHFPYGSPPNRCHPRKSSGWFQSNRNTKASQGWAEFPEAIANQSFSQIARPKSSIFHEQYVFVARPFVAGCRFYILQRPICHLLLRKCVPTISVDQRR